MSARTVLVGGLVVALLGAAGCSGAPSSGGSAAGDSASSSSSKIGPTGAEAGAGPVVNGVDAVRDPLATVEAPMPLKGDPQAKIKVDLLGLKRQGKVLNLTAALTPTTSLSESMSLYDMLGGQSWKPQLVDAQNLKLYSVVSSNSNGPLQSATVGDRVPPASPLLVYAVFAAPPPDVTAINVQIADQVPTFENVPIG